MSLLRISRFLTLAILGMFLLACSALPESTPEMSVSSPQLSTEQRDELLDMLKSHKDNKALIQQWRESQAGVKRLLAIESDLKVLIDQLSGLVDEGSPSEEQTSTSSKIPIKKSETSRTKMAIPATDGDNKNKNFVQPFAKTKLDKNIKLAGLIALQLSAMKDPESITKLWQKLVKMQPTLLGTLSPATEAVERSNGTIYRLKAGPFDNKKDANMHCNKLQQVNVSCMVTQYAGSAKYLLIN